jgi:hypothetical protein
MTKCKPTQEVSRVGREWCGERVPDDSICERCGGCDYCCTCPEADDPVDDEDD